MKRIIALMLGCLMLAACGTCDPVADDTHPRAKPVSVEDRSKAALK